MVNEKRLCKRLSSGSAEALAEAVRTFSGYVRTVVRNFSRGTLTNEDIDDVVSDVFIRLWEARENLKSDVGLRAYLSEIARNLVKNRFRSAAPPAEDISEIEVPSDFLVEDAAEMNEMMSCLYEGMKKLSKEDEEVFYRFYFNGESAREIAEKKGTTKAAVDMRLRRVRQKLKSFLNERGFYNV